MTKRTGGRTRFGKERQPAQSTRSRAVMSTTRATVRPTGRSQLPANAAHKENGTSGTEIDPPDDQTSRKGETPLFVTTTPALPDISDFFPEHM